MLDEKAAVADLRTDEGGTVAAGDVADDAEDVADDDEMRTTTATTKWNGADDAVASSMYQMTRWTAAVAVVAGDSRRPSRESLPRYLVAGAGVVLKRWMTTMIYLDACCG